MWSWTLVMVLARFSWLSKVMGLCLVIAQVDLKRVMSKGLALVMLKCTLIHACCYYDLMIDLLDYVFDYMICMLTWLDLMLLFLWCTCLWPNDMSYWLIWSCWKCIKVFNKKCVLIEMFPFLSMISKNVCIWSHT